MAQFWYDNILDFTKGEIPSIPQYFKDTVEPPYNMIILDRYQHISDYYKIPDETIVVFTDPTPFGGKWQEAPSFQNLKEDFGHRNILFCIIDKREIESQRDLLAEVFNNKIKTIYGKTYMLFIPGHYNDTINNSKFLSKILSENGNIVLSQFKIELGDRFSCLENQRHPMERYVRDNTFKVQGRGFYAYRVCTKKNALESPSSTPVTSSSIPSSVPPAPSAPPPALSVPPPALSVPPPAPSAPPPAPSAPPSALSVPPPAPSAPPPFTIGPSGKIINEHILDFTDPENPPIEPEWFKEKKCLKVCLAAGDGWYQNANTDIEKLPEYDIYASIGESGLECLNLQYILDYHHHQKLICYLNASESNQLDAFATMFKNRCQFIATDDHRVYIRPDIYGLTLLAIGGKLIDYDKETDEDYSKRTGKASGSTVAAVRGTSTLPEPEGVKFNRTPYKHSTRIYICTKVLSTE